MSFGKYRLLCTKTNIQVDIADELIKRINAGRLIIRKHGGYEDFFHFIRNKYGDGQGLSKSNISNIIKQLKEGQNLEDHQQKIELLEQEISAFLRSNRPSRSSFYDTRWYLYFFYVGNSQKNRVGLGRTVLSIDSSGIVELKNINDEVSQDYKGSFELINDYVIFFDLFGKGDGAKLHLKVLTREKPTDILLGISLSFEMQTVISGTVVLELKSSAVDVIAEHRDLPTLSPGFFTSNSKEFFTIPSEIRRFLSVKAHNHLKIPKNVFSLNSLKEFMNEYRHDKRSLFFDLDKPRLYISAQVEAIEDSDIYENIQKTLKSIKTEIEKKTNFEIDVSYPGEELDHSGDEKRRYLASNLYSLKHTKYFVLFLSNDTASRSLIELGLALTNCKVVLVFYKVGTKFTDRLSILSDSEIFKAFKTYPYASSINENEEAIVNAIINMIEDHKYDTNVKLY